MKVLDLFVKIKVYLALGLIAVVVVISVYLVVDKSLFDQVTIDSNNYSDQRFVSKKSRFKEEFQKVESIKENQEARGITVDESKVPDKYKLNGNVVITQDKLDTPDKRVDTQAKAYMCFATLTSKTSAQYKLQHDSKYKAWTDENGFRRIGHYYMVAMGSYYTGTTMGNTFRVTTDTGKVFDVITGDQKSDAHTDSKHQYRSCIASNLNSDRGNVIEFIVSCGSSHKKINCREVTPNLISIVKQMGTASALDEFSGNIVKVEKLQDTAVKTLLADLY